MCSVPQTQIILCTLTIKRWPMVSTAEWRLFIIAEAKQNKADEQTKEEQKMYIQRDMLKEH